MLSSRALVTLLTASLLINGVAIYGLAIMFRQSSALIEENANLFDTIMNLRREIENLKSQVEYYKNQLEYYSTYIAQKSEGGIALSGEAEINLVAVKTVYTGSFLMRYEGVILKCIIELHKGSGRVLINTVPYIGIDLQRSAQTAALAAENFTGVDLSATDIIVTVKAEEEIQIVDGPSAGAAIAIAVIAAIRGDELSDKVFITGTIMPDGSIGAVGGIIEKAEAAALRGGEVFLVPRGQGTVIVWRRAERRTPLGTIPAWELVEVNLEDYLRQKGYQMLVREVSNIAEAYEYFCRK